MDPAHIINMANSFYDSCVLFTASDLGIFATIAANGKANAEKIAESCSLDPRGARLLLDACCALDLLVKENNDYSNTPTVDMFLVPGAPGDLSGAIRYNRDVYDAWGKLTELIRTGKPVERPEVHLGDDEDRTRTFVLSMHGRAIGIGRTVVPHLKLTGRRKLFDVGGGPGTYSVLIAQANPEIDCTVLDLPDVVKVADELISKAGMQDRVHTIGGDYHTAVFPKDMDVVNFFGVLHQESPESILNLFKRAYAALAPGGLIHVLDMMTDATHTQPQFSALFAVNMALTTQNGWVFSEDELKGWLTEAGFTDFSCEPLPQPMPHWLASAQKPA
ncbi:MAG: methyltransferase domain-containing protein [Kiritimatiellae bacterium]|nr:methyltransferase domain-containing protein [Kiritimatiellia bacterium]